MRIFYDMRYVHLPSMGCRESVSQAPAPLILIVLRAIIDHRYQKVIHLACYKVVAHNIPEKKIETFVISNIWTAGRFDPMRGRALSHDILSNKLFSGFTFTSANAGIHS